MLAVRVRSVLPRMCLRIGSPQKSDIDTTQRTLQGKHQHRGLYCGMGPPHQSLADVIGQKNIQRPNSFESQAHLHSQTGQMDPHLEADTLHRIEKHWKPRLEKVLPTPPPGADKYYVLSMFPYPSGKLHMGHVRVYSISDTFAHYYRMQGYRVIHPMGWDAFGLPAENAAIENKVSPAKWTVENIAKMKEQLLELGCTFDWGREISTCDPKYYRWTQELFLKLHQRGLVYQAESMVNWDPVDQTVLADEQVDGEGRSWRSGALVEKKPLKQWFFRTTAFAESLYSGLDDPSLVNWRDIIAAQKNWLGAPSGTKLELSVLQVHNIILMLGFCQGNCEILLNREGKRRVAV